MNHCRFVYSRLRHTGCWRLNILHRDSDQLHLSRSGPIIASGDHATSTNVNARTLPSRLHGVRSIVKLEASAAEVYRMVLADSELEPVASTDRAGDNSKDAKDSTGRSRENFLGPLQEIRTSHRELRDRGLKLLPNAEQRELRKKSGVWGHWAAELMKCGGMRLHLRSPDVSSTLRRLAVGERGALRILEAMKLPSAADKTVTTYLADATKATRDSADVLDELASP